MPTILFTATPKLPRDLAHLGYKLGDQIVLTDDAANRWLRRGVAEIVPDAPAQDAGDLTSETAPAEASPPPVPASSRATGATPGRARP